MIEMKNGKKILTTPISAEDLGGSRDEILRHPFYKNLSLVTVSSPEVVWAYEEAMVLQDEPLRNQLLADSRGFLLCTG